MIVYACADLMFASKVSAACGAVGAVSRPARSEAMLAARLDRVEDGKPCDAVTVVMVELTRDDALTLIARAAAHAGRPAVVAFGPHVEVDRLAAAQQAGADVVLTRGAFAQQLPALVARYGST